MELEQAMLKRKNLQTSENCVRGTQTQRAHRLMWAHSRTAPCMHVSQWIRTGDLAELAAFAEVRWAVWSRSQRAALACVRHHPRLCKEKK